MKRGCLTILENDIRFLLSTTKIRLKKSYSSVGCSFSFSFLLRVAAKLKWGLLHRRWISAFMS